VLHALAIASVLLAGPGWLGIALAIRDAAARDAEQAIPERDTARDMRLAA
jgi:hypothetical protein